MKYRTKSVTVEAVQWTGENEAEVEAVFGKWPTKNERALGRWYTSEGFVWPDGDFQRNHEPLPESTLDLEAIEARKTAEARVTALEAVVREVAAANLLAPNESDGVEYCLACGTGTWDDCPPDCFKVRAVELMEGK